MSNPSSITIDLSEHPLLGVSILFVVFYIFYKWIFVVMANDPVSSYSSEKVNRKVYPKIPRTVTNITITTHTDAQGEARRSFNINFKVFTEIVASDEAQRIIQEIVDAEIAKFANDGSVENVVAGCRFVCETTLSFDLRIETTERSGDLCFGFEVEGNSLKLMYLKEKDVVDR